MPNTPQVDFSTIKDLEDYINLQYDESTNTEGQMNVRIEHNALFGIMKFLKVAYAIPNQPPTVNAGTDQSINLPTNTIAIVASANDPDGTIASVLWQQVSGPTQATISPTANLSTTFSNLAEGAYVFRITVTDSRGATATDTITVTVVYVLPSVSTGPNINITQPTSSATVSATVTAGSYAISSTVLPLWEVTASPAGTTPVIANPNNASTNVTGLTAVGTYTLRHTVQDINGRSANSSVSIIVT